MEKSKDTYKGDRKVPTEKEKENQDETKEKDDGFVVDLSFLFNPPDKEDKTEKKNEKDERNNSEEEKVDDSAQVTDPDQEDENLYPDTGNYVIVQSLPGEDVESKKPETQESNSGSSTDTAANAKSSEQSSNKKDEPSGETLDKTDPSVFQPYDAKKDCNAQKEIFSNSTGLGIRLGRTALTSGVFGYKYDFDMSILTRSDKYLASIVFGMESITPITGSDLDESVKGGLGLFRLGLELRRYAFSNQTLFNPFVGFTGGISLLCWNYTNSLHTDVGSISVDSLLGLYLMAPLGVEIYRSQQTSFSILVIPEVYGFAGMTNQGFENDYFKPYANIKLAGEFNYVPWLYERRMTGDDE